MQFHPYTALVPRSPKKSRPTQGARLLALRKAAGLSQAELARLVGETQENISFWERTDKPPRSDVLPKLARVLHVRLEVLLGAEPLADTQPPPLAAGPGPAGQVQRIFEEVRKLPRRQQQRVIDVVAAIVNEFKRKAS
jgi:transcriptional regulator with XRE-family HTH domain